MSWHYLQGQEAASWEGDCLDGAPSALSRLIPMRAESYSLDKLTDALADFQSGTTCGHSTASDGKAPSMSSAVDFHVRTSAQPERERESQEQSPVCGHTWHALSVRFDLVLCSWKTAHCLFPEDLQWSSVILPRWGMMRDGECWERNTLALPTRDTDSGLWPTPLAEDIKTDCPSERKRDCPHMETEIKLRLGLSVECKQRLHPWWMEMLMGWPIGWTDCDALEMDRFRQWCDSHGMR